MLKPAHHIVRNGPNCLNLPPCGPCAFVPGGLYYAPEGAARLWNPSIAASSQFRGGSSVCCSRRHIRANCAAEPLPRPSPGHPTHCAPAASAPFATRGADRPLRFLPTPATPQPPRSRFSILIVVTPSATPPPPYGWFSIPIVVTPCHTGSHASIASFP